MNASTELVFTADEGRCLDVLDTLLGHFRVGSLRGPVTLEAPRRALLEVGAQRISRTVLRYLVDKGGHRENLWLRDGRRTLGRAWTPSLNEGFSLRYSTASQTLWLRGAQVFAALTTTDAERTRSRVLRTVVKTTGTDSGDWVFYAIAYTSLASFRLSDGELSELRRLLCVGSPLATLLWPDGASRAENLRGHLRRLIHECNARIVECIEDRLSTAWSSYAARVWRARFGVEQLRTPWNALGSTLNAWLDVLDEAQRLDLSRPLLSFSRALFHGPFAQGGEAVRERLANTPDLTSLQQRDALFASVASVVDICVRLLRYRDQLAAERYGDDRYEEAQLYVRDADRVLTPLRQQVESVAHALSGMLG